MASPTLNHGDGSLQRSSPLPLGSRIILAARSEKEAGRAGNFVKRLLTTEVADPTYLEALQRIIAEIHGCPSEHWDSVHVREVFGETVIWEGDVEIFYVFGHVRARRCFAWVSDRAQLGRPVRFFAVLDSTLVRTPDDAVKYARIAESANLIDEVSKVSPPV